MVSFSQADFGVFVLVAIGAIPLQLWRFRSLHAERLRTDRYALFASRDQWIQLVADNHIAEDDVLFQFLYREMNDIIPRAKPMTLRNVVNAIGASRVINDNEFATKTIQLIRHSNAEVRAAADTYFRALMQILIGRSWFLRVSISLTRSGLLAASAVRNTLGRIFKTQAEAYRLHATLSQMCPI